MRKVIAYPITLIHDAIYALVISIFHPIQVIAYNLFGYTAHKKTVDLMNFFLMGNIFTLFCRPSFYGLKNIPKNKPLIIVANHQSMYDISPVAWAFRKHHVKFISKKELGKNIPSVSYNLQKGGSVLIDRKSGSQSIKQILQLGKKMEANNWSVCIYPEGTRSKTGELRKFLPAGIKTLLKASPSAIIIPFAIDGNYKLHKWGMFPLNFGKRLKYTALPPVDRTNLTDEELMVEIRNRIKKHLRVCSEISPRI